MVKAPEDRDTRSRPGAGQMQADGPPECPAVTVLQKQYKLTPLSAWGQPYTPPARVMVPAGLDPKTPPVQRIQRMDAGEFFGRFARLMKDNLPASADAASFSMPLLR